jgi:hypothetical protein
MADSHSFPPDFPNAEIPSGLYSNVIPRDDVYTVVAEDVLWRARKKSFDGIRLVQTPFNNLTMALYSKLDFFGHTLGETNDDLKALICAAANPSRLNSEALAP